MNHALGHGTLHFRASRAQGLGSRSLVATRDGRFYLLHERSHARLAGMVTFGPDGSLTNALTR